MFQLHSRIAFDIPNQYISDKWISNLFLFTEWLIMMLCGAAFCFLLRWLSWIRSGARYKTLKRPNRRRHRITNVRALARSLVVTVTMTDYKLQNRRTAICDAFHYYSIITNNNVHAAAMARVTLIRNKCIYIFITSRRVFFYCWRRKKHS